MSFILTEYRIKKIKCHINVYFIRIMFLILVSIEEIGFTMAFSYWATIKVPLCKANSTYLLFPYDKDFKSETNTIFMIDMEIQDIMLVVTQTFVSLLCGMSFKIFLSMIQFIRKHRLRNSENLYFGLLKVCGRFLKEHVSTPQVNSVNIGNKAS